MYNIQPKQNKTIAAFQEISYTLIVDDEQLQAPKLFYFTVCLMLSLENIHINPNPQHPALLQLIVLLVFRGILLGLVVDLSQLVDRVL